MKETTIITPRTWLKRNAPNPLTERLFHHYRGEVMTFPQLPLTAQAAMYWYMGVDNDIWEIPKDMQSITRGHAGEEWVVPMKQRLFANLPQLAELRKNYRIGLVTIPTSVIKREIKASGQLRDLLPGGFGTFQRYHQWYLDHIPTPHHPTTNLWPCVLSIIRGEVLEDGWHRFHSYVRSRVTHIPCLHYIEQQ